jgi:hypothetical protein
MFYSDTISNTIFEVNFMSIKTAISGALLGMAAGALLGTVYPIPISGSNMRHMRRALRRGAKFSVHKINSMLP